MSLSTHPARTDPAPRSLLGGLGELGSTWLLLGLLATVLLGTAGVGALLTAAG